MGMTMRAHIGTRVHTQARASRHAHAHTNTHAHTRTQCQLSPRQADLNELSSWLPPFFKVLLTMLLLHLERQPGPQDALEGGVRL